MHSAIVERERAFDEQLRRRVANAPLDPALLTAARRWSEAVWEQASALGPFGIPQGEIEIGVALASRPVFVCGAHRSGTTLVRDLLDGHPALTVLPSEGTFFTNLEATLAAERRDRRLRAMGVEWLRRLANPINRPPYWLLGRSVGDASPYVAVARALMTWWVVIESRMARDVSSWPLVAVVLAYASRSGRLSHAARGTRWAEKTPTNERFAERLLGEFPDARIVHVVRHPFAVFASRKQLETRVTGAFRNQRRALDDLAMSYRVAIERGASDADSVYRVVRYEDLVETPEATVGRLARFLDIELLPILLQPTVAGRPASANSSFDLPGTTGIVRRGPAARAVELSAADRDLVTASVGSLARRLDYEL